VIGLLVLHQVPGLWPVAGIGFVVAAGIGAERTGARTALTGAGHRRDEVPDPSELSMNPSTGPSPGLERRCAVEP
jgi:inner membrane transporter RhtA